jgi:hypothetical protein
VLLVLPVQPARLVLRVLRVLLAQLVQQGLPGRGWSTTATAPGRSEMSISGYTKAGADAAITNAIAYEKTRADAAYAPVGGGAAFINSWKGPWSSAVAYAVGDIVERHGSSYLAVNANTANDPDADFTTNPVGSMVSASPLSFGSNNAGAMGFTVSRAETVYAINTAGIGGNDQTTGTIGIADDIAPAGGGVHWLGKGTPDGTNVILDTPAYLVPGVTYWLVVTNIYGWVVANNTTVTYSNMTWNNQFWYGNNGSVPYTLGTYNFRVILYGSTGSDWALVAARGANLPVSVALTDAPTITVTAPPHQAMLTVTLGGNRTLGNPSGAFADGHRFQVRARQDATGSRTLAYGTMYAFSASIPSPTLTTAAGKADLLTWQYDATLGKFVLISIVQGS